MKGFTPWWKILKQNVTIHTYDHNFGIVLPCPSGISWVQQTEGVMCGHVHVEGIYIPLREPKEILKAIQMANYTYNQKRITKFWQELKDWLKENESLEFEEVEAPEKMPINQEGLQWIRITRWDSKIDERNLLVGETVAFYYPNCD